MSLPHLLPPDLLVLTASLPSAFLHLSLSSLTCYHCRMRFRGTEGALPICVQRSWIIFASGLDDVARVGIGRRVNASLDVCHGM